MVPHCRGRRQSQMFPGKSLASWIYYHFRIHILHVLRFQIQRLQTHRAAAKVKIDAEVPQEIAAEDAALREPSSLIYRFHIEHCRIDLFEFTESETQSRQLQNLDIFRY